MTWGKSLSASATAVALLASVQAPQARAQSQARISSLEDVAFGTINSPVDQSISQNVCAYAAQGFLQPVGYSVRATGSGGGGAFALSSGAATLAYEVQWADSPNQTGGVALTAGVLSTGFDNAAFLQNCTFQATGTATLTVTIRAAQIAAATAGNYSGTLQITIVPE